MPRAAVSKQRTLLIELAGGQQSERSVAAEAEDSVCYFTSKLSAELRNAIYEFALQFDRPLFPTKRRKTKGNGKVTSADKSTTIALLLVNKQIHSETVWIFYRSNKFAVSAESNKTLRRLWKSPHLEQIIDLEIIGFYTDDADELIKLRRKLKNYAPKLRTLTLTAEEVVEFLAHEEHLPKIKVESAEIGKIVCSRLIKDVDVVLQWPTLIECWKDFAFKREIAFTATRHIHCILSSLQHRVNFHNVTHPELLEFFVTDPKDGEDKLQLKNQSALQVARFNFALASVCWDDEVGNVEFPVQVGDGIAKRWSFREGIFDDSGDCNASSIEEDAIIHYC